MEGGRRRGLVAWRLGQVFGTRHSVFGTRHSVFGTRHSVFGILHSVLGIWKWAFDELRRDKVGMRKWEVFEVGIRNKWKVGIKKNRVFYIRPSSFYVAVRDSRAAICGSMRPVTRGERVYRNMNRKDTWPKYGVKMERDSSRFRRTNQGCRLIKRPRCR